MELIYNEAVDLIFAMKRFADRHKPQATPFPRYQELQGWCLEYEEKLSPFLLNDISLIFEKMIMPSLYCFHLAYANNISKAENFLSALETLEAEDFNRRFRNDYLGIPDGEPGPDEINKALFDDGLHPGYDSEVESALIHGFLKEPGSFLKRMHKTYADFYRLAFLPGSKVFTDIRNEKSEWHRERLEQDPETYFIRLGLKDFYSDTKDRNRISLFFAFFADNEITSFWKIRSVVIGAAADQRILQRSARDKSDIFFSCFGDPKRLEILRLTADRPWYGSELAHQFNVQPATLSYHISKLVDAELLHISKGDARRFYYSLNREALREYLKYVSQDLLGMEE